MPVLTAEAQLIEVQSAISRLLTTDWSRMTVDQREVWKHNLEQLTAREKLLKQEYREELTNDGNTISPIRVRGFEVDI